MEKEESREELLQQVQKLRERQLELERENTGVKELKFEFLARMSHETRTPLNAIIGLSDLTLKTELSPKQSDYISKIRTSSMQLLGIISDLMDYIRVQAKDLRLEPAVFAPARMLEELAARLGSECPHKGVDFYTRISHSLPKAVRGDAARLSQVLEHLLRNAFKFTSQGEVALSGELIESAEGKHKLRFGVRDTGIGINPAQLSALFEPFAQADVSMNRRYGGTGIGLALCRGIAELMGSQIEAQSEPGKGSFFFLSVWLDAASENDLAKPSESGATSFGLAEDFLNGKRILLVEDNLINQEVAGELLRGKGGMVSLAAHGGEALEALGKKKFDVVLMDIQMPVMDGIEATQRIRKISGLESLPIIALTAHALDEDRKRCFEAGMNGYLTKPIDPPALFSTLAKHLGIDAVSPLKPADFSPAPSQPQTGDGGWPWPVPGIEVDSALRRLGNNKSLFKKILREVTEGFSNYHQEIVDALNIGERETAVRLAHTIKGVAGNISAEALAEVSKILERELGQPEASPPLALLEEFSLKLKEVLDSANELCGQSVLVASNTESKPQVQKLKILLVDDANINRVLFGQLLTAHGHEVITAENGKDACRKIFMESRPDSPFDLILMDIEMPEMDGLSATRMIRGILKSSAAPPCRKDIPIIALTSHESGEKMQSFLEAGMNASVKKSFDGDELLSVIQLVMENIPGGLKRAPEQCAEACPTASEQISELIRKLAKHLVNGELDAQDCAFELAQLLEDAPCSEELRRLERLVFSFDFSGALSVLYEIAGILEIQLRN